MWTDNASDIDLLFYEPYAKIISEDAISLGKDPLTIGVFGLWGAGKSTLLKLITSKYEANKNILCVNINAWMFEGYEDAKIAIMETLLSELIEKAPDKEIKKGFISLLKKVDLFKVATKTISLASPMIASIATGTPIPLVLSMPKGAKELETAIKTVSDTAQNLKNDYIKDNSNIDDNSIVNNVRKFRTEFEGQIEKLEIDRVVVLLDDLDRCQPERIIEILEAIKLFLSVNKTTFIIAADENVIQYAVKKKYPAMDGLKAELDKEYIEKLIQLPITVPELSEKDIQNYLTILVYQKYMPLTDFTCFISKVQENRLLILEDTIKKEAFDQIIDKHKLSYTDKEAFDQMNNVILGIRGIVATTLKGNPRQAKRFLNTFDTKRRLADIYYPGEIKPELLAKLLVLHKLDPSLFNELNEWNKEYDTENKKYKAMKAGLEDPSSYSDFAKWYVPKIIKWITCSPIDLETEPLHKYFYLTREILNTSVDFISALTQEARKLLDQLGKANPGTAPGIIEGISQLSGEDIDGIMKTMLQKIKTGDTPSFIYSALYNKFNIYRSDIEEALIQGEHKIMASDIPTWQTMYATSPESMLKVLESFKTKKLVKPEAIDRIKGTQVN